MGNRQLVAVADSLNLYCPFRIWIGNRQLVASCRFVELVFIESATDSATGNKLPVADSLNLYCPFRIWIDSLNLSVSNVNRQPATKSATGYLGPYMVSFKSATESACCNWIGNRQPTANFMFWIGKRQLNRQPATCCWLYVLNRQPATESATGNPLLTLCFESANGNWIDNRQPTANFMFWIGNRQLDRRPATDNRQPTANFMFWIGNWQLNRQPATHC